MENHFTLRNSDDIVHITIRVKPKFYAYILLFITSTLLTIPFLAGGFKNIDSIIISLIIIILWILFPIKYALWNVFGQEKLIITQKSVSYQYNYGFVQNNLISKPYEDLIISFESLLVTNDNQFGKILFKTEDETTGLRKILHQTSIYLSRKQYHLITDEIFKVQNF